EEHIEDRISGVVGAGLAVDVEEDDIGAIGHSLVDVGANHGVAYFAIVEKFDGALAVAIGVMRFDVGQQVGQRLEEVRFTGAKESADPYANPVGDGGVAEVGAVGLEKAAEMLFQFVGDNVLVQFLIHRGVVR